MGKKPKVNKLAKMSDEERARYLQHRADMEEEARRRKRELIAKFIKNKLDKEEAYSRMNTAKINQGWRYILRRIKCKQMMQDIQGLRNSFSFMVERKNRQIQMLLQALEDSDEQHRRAFQAHTETISYFLNIGSQRLDKLQADYEHRKNVLLEIGEKEDAYITESQERAELQLKLIIFIERRNFEKKKNELELAIATNKHDTVLEHEELMREVCRPKHLEIEHFWKQLKDTYNSFLEQVNPIIGHYNTLKEKDEFYQKDIARNELQIEQASEHLLNLQKEWINTTNRMSYKVQKMNRHKEDLAKKYMQMKKEAKTESSRSSHQLEFMVNCSQDAIKHLEHLKSKMDKIMQLAEISAKYQTLEDEKTLSEIELNEELEDFEHLDKDMVAEWREYQKMNKFMLKLNRVKVQTLCLKTERTKLLKENAQLKYYIKKYLTEMALRGGKDRPLSVQVMTETQKNSGNAGKVVNRPVTCIEGVLSNVVQHEQRMKNIEKRNRENCIKTYPRVQCWM